MCISNTFKRLNSQQFIVNKIKIVVEMLTKLSSYHKRFKQLCDENKNVQKHIHTSCVSYMVFKIIIYIK